VAGDNELAEEADRWVLPVGYAVVTQLRIDFAFGITVAERLDIRIEGRFRVEGPDGATTFDPEQPGAVGPLADLHQAKVVEAVVYKDGGLALAFDDGRRLLAGPDEKYEAFTVNGAFPDQTPFTIVSLPGGGLAEFVSGETYDMGSIDDALDDP
jgi:hypothetical protein